jgi:L-ascorbate metabolism protein UlaG (beta-lactamase superfamily)
MKVGAFEVVFYETPHSPRPLFPGNIEQALRPPAKSSEYKLGKNYSYLLRHPRGNVLIVPSANYVAGLFDDVRADVVFLGIATLGKQPEEFTRTYWNEVVKKTGARLVVPIHWDHFGRPLDEPLRPLPYFMDDMSRSMTILQQLAKTDGVKIGFAPLYTPFVCIAKR